MKWIILSLVLISCGKEPLFGPFKEAKTNQRVSALTASDELSWDGRQHFAIQWLNKPEVGTNTSFNIKFWDSYQHNFLGPYQLLEKPLCVFLWMKMPDGSEHGSAPVTLLKKEDHYFVDEAYFIMNGLWQIRIRTVENLSQCQNDKNDPYLEEEILEIYIN